TWLHGVEHREGVSDLTTPQFAGSAIWRTTPRFHLMLETVDAFEEDIDDDLAITRERVITVSPGFRRAWNVGDSQIVVGAALPVTTGETDTTIGALSYFSYELPFRK